MNLPTSRNETASSAAPISSSLANALQDCVIGMKHPESEEVISGFDFVAVSTAIDNVLDEGSWTTTGGNALAIYAGLRIPVGTRITSIAFTYVVGAAGSVTYELRRRNLATGAISTIATGTDATGTAIETGALAAINHTVATGYAYYLRVTSISSSSILYSASVKRDRL